MPWINHVHPCVFFATFQTAQRPGLLKYTSWGTSDKSECESSTSSNQLHLKNWNAAGFHSHLLDKERLSAWWSESQAKVREDFFYLLDLPQHRNAISSCPVLAFPAGRGAQSCCWGGPEEMSEIPGASLPGRPHGATSDPFLNHLRLQTETLTFAKYSQLLQYTANAKICLERKKRKQKKMKKKIMLIVQKVKGCFSVPQRRCGPGGEGCTSSSAEGCQV